MPEVTNPAEEYFKDGLWAWDATNSKWIKVVADPATGYLKIDIGAEIEVGQTDPDDLRAGVYVWDGGVWRKAGCTSGGYLKNWHTGQSADVEVAQTTPADMRTLAHGWDGSYARKLPMVWGYTSRWRENLGGTQAAPGNFSKNTSAVPAGYVYVAQFAFVRNDSRNPTASAINLISGGTYYIMAFETAPVQWVPLVWNGGVPLIEGDVLNVIMTGCLAGDVCEAGVWGYQMKINA